MLEEINRHKHIIKITSQRNVFLSLTIMLAISNTILAFKIFSLKEKIVMVPGITREMSIEDGLVSKSYLEESALLFASTLLDLSPGSIMHKKNIILKYASHRSKSNLEYLKQYFTNREIDHKKFKLSTSFTPKKIHLDNKKLEVVMDGVLMSNFGKKGFKERSARYFLKFEYVGGFLKLMQFKELKILKDKT